jgi:hypothetical protein
LISNSKESNIWFACLQTFLILNKMKEKIGFQIWRKENRTLWIIEQIFLHLTEKHNQIFISKQSSTNRFVFFLFNNKQKSIDILDLICDRELKKRDLEIKAYFYYIFRLFIMKCMSKISIEYVQQIYRQLNLQLMVSYRSIRKKSSRLKNDSLFAVS